MKARVPAPSTMPSVAKARGSAMMPAPATERREGVCDVGPASSATCLGSHVHSQQPCRRERHTASAQLLPSATHLLHSQPSRLPMMVVARLAVACSKQAVQQLGLVLTTSRVHCTLHFKEKCTWYIPAPARLRTLSGATAHLCEARLPPQHHGRQLCIG